MVDIILNIFASVLLVAAVAALSVVAAGLFLELTKEARQTRNRKEVETNRGQTLVVLKELRDGAKVFCPDSGYYMDTGLLFLEKNPAFRTYEWLAANLTDEGAEWAKAKLEEKKAWHEVNNG